MTSLSNLSHPARAEAIDPVVLGKTRAKQFSLIKDANPNCKLGDKVMCVQIHGDASFTGQGVVMESLGLSKIRTMETAEQGAEYICR